MLTKLKYVGVPIQDLIEIYCIYIRSITEYCSTVFHISLNQQLQNKIESTQAGLLGPIRVVAPCVCDDILDLYYDGAYQRDPQEAY